MKNRGNQKSIVSQKARQELSKKFVRDTLNVREKCQKN